MSGLEKTAARLIGFVDPIGRAPSFVIPVFEGGAGENSLFVQHIAADGKILGFTSFQENSLRFTAYDDGPMRKRGHIALWAFRFSEREYVVGSRAELARVLKSRRHEFDRRRFLYLQIVQFCAIEDEFGPSLQAAYHQLREQSVKSAEAWRDVVFIPAYVRSVVAGLLPGRNKRSFERIQVTVVDRSAMVRLPPDVFDQLTRNRGLQKLAQRVTTTSQLLEIEHVKAIRSEPSGGGDKALVRDLSAEIRALVIGCGEEGRSAISFLSKRERKTSQVANVFSIESDVAAFFNRTSSLSLRPDTRTLKISRPQNILDFVRKPRPRRYRKILSQRRMAPIQKELVVFVISLQDALNDNWAELLLRASGHYRGTGHRVMVLCTRHIHRAGGTESGLVNYLLKSLRSVVDYWVFAPPKHLKNKTHELDKDAVNGILDIALANDEGQGRRHIFPRPVLDSEISLAAVAAAEGKTEISAIERTMERLLSDVPVFSATRSVLLLETEHATQEDLHEALQGLDAALGGWQEPYFVNQERRPGRGARTAILLSDIRTISSEELEFERACRHRLQALGLKANNEVGSKFLVYLGAESIEVECKWSTTPLSRAEVEQYAKERVQKRVLITNWPVRGWQVSQALAANLILRPYLHLADLAESLRKLPNRKKKAR